MIEFEFVFVLYALVLGLSMVELLSGFGRAMEYKFARDAAQKAFEIGWLTPLFAIFVMLDLISFWVFAWVVRDLITVDSVTIAGVTAFAASYYLAARLVFPTQPQSFTDLDVHFYRVRRIVLGILIALVVVQWIYLATQTSLGAIASNPFAIGMTALLLVLMLLAMIWRNDRLNTALLGALIARYLFLYFVI
ncbi:hypothetical protein [Erythrobacter sp.]|uniref:hypothetical protein n=1 Tax=Erythrobacter sp. TaxID=1042 RepID=UPI002ECEC045|nr:hypothetical protein [Erythrobacter sp.]